MNLHDDRVKFKEVASKLFEFTDDSRFLIARSDDRKGVKIVSLEDCQVVQVIEKIHSRPILELFLAYGNNHLISVGVDKKLI